MNYKYNNYTIYVHINKINNKKYVGITRCKVHDRWGNNGCRYKEQVFGRAIEKYGWNNFDHVILEEHLEKKDAEDKEIHYISLWNTTNPLYGYNVQNGGNSTGRCDEKTKAKLREQNLGGKSPRAIKINQYSKDGVYIKTWDSSKDIERELGIQSSNVIACCKEKYNQTHGYVWRYYNGSNENIEPLKPISHGVKKKIVQKSLDNKTIAIWESIKNASEKLNIRRVLIMQVCQNKKENDGKYIWEYAKF